jgi:dTDP-4-amino-4,6-dideoxygalactose transaminase
VIPFNKPYATGRELGYIQEAIDNGHLSGNGPFDLRCSRWLEQQSGSRRAFLMSSGTAALEMAALLLGLAPGDEVIMPSFTFVTTASAVVRQGATPVFVDIQPDTLNIDVAAAEAAITGRTKAIMPVHYAGVGCDMNALGDLAQERGLALIEDAAQGVLSTYSGRALGSLGDLGCLSFHETKNVTSGEGGALLVNVDELVERAEIIQHKGTDRSRFLRGEVDRYSWVDLGSSFLSSEVNAAFLWAQMEQARHITDLRLATWDTYQTAFAALDDTAARRPVIPEQCSHNAHMYYLLLRDRGARDALIAGLADRGVQAVFHYVPLHSSPAGRRFGRAAGPLPVTDSVSARLVRLPLWAGMSPEQVNRVVVETLALVS